MGVYLDTISRFAIDLLSGDASEENEKNQNILIATVAIGTIVSLGLLYRSYYESKRSTDVPGLNGEPPKMPEKESSNEGTYHNAEKNSATFEEKVTEFELNTILIKESQNEALKAAGLINNGSFDSAVSLISRFFF